MYRKHSPLFPRGLLQKLCLCRYKIPRGETRWLQLCYFYLTHSALQSPLFLHETLDLVFDDFGSVLLLACLVSFFMFTICSVILTNQIDNSCSRNICLWSHDL